MPASLVTSDLPAPGTNPTTRSTMRHFYTSEELDRATHLRGDEAWVRARLADRRSRALPVWRGRAFVTLEREGDESPQPEYLSVGEARKLAGDNAAAAILLGVGTSHAYFAVDLSNIDDPEQEPLLSERGRFVSLRRVGPLLDRHGGGLLAYAQAMTHWHRQNRFCGACGSPTRAEQAGHWLRCTAASCDTLHFPRTDPAIIVRVTHEDRCLLGRQTQWPGRLYSVLAGFVEPGEGLEDAVAREVFEEAGVRIDGASYNSSQPWPFPASLMIGFTAHALDDAIRVDGDELEDVRWFTRSELDREIEAGNVILPSEVSLARHLIHGWHRRDADATGEQR